MNAHHMMNPGAFGLSGLLLTQNYRTDDFFTSYDVWTYTWNYRNEMTGFSEKNASGTVIASGTYAYDSLDRRIGVDETSGGTTTQTWIVYNGNSNTPYAMFNGSGTLLERYLAGPSYVPGVTGMIARTNASGVTDWYLTGKLGSAPDIVDSSGTVIDHISYGAFGSIRAETNPSSAGRFKFDGMRYETIAGLHNDRHRGYSSSDSRFVSIDPTEYHYAYDNLHIYVNNNAVNNSDFNGFYPDGSKDSGGGTSPQDIQYQFDSQARLNGMDEAQLKQLNDSTNNISEPYFSFYGDHCERRRIKFYFQNNSTIHYTLQRTSWEIIDGTIWVRHCGVVLKFRNGTIFYIDDGGIQFTNGRGGIGEYRISTHSDIPMNWKENKAGYGSWDYLWSVIDESLSQSLPPNFIDPGNKVNHT